MTKPSNAERRTAQAMVATYLQVARSVETARWIQQTRARKLQQRAEKTTKMADLLRIQQQIDAQEQQANIIESASRRLRMQAPTLRQFLDNGLSLEDLERMGVQDVIDPTELAASTDPSTSDAVVNTPSEPTQEEQQDES